MECPSCGSEYEQLGTHWQWNPEHRPTPTQEQMEILDGILMGDGTIQKNAGHNHIRLTSITKDFLDWYDEKMGVFTTGVFDLVSGEEMAAHNRERGFRPNAKAENYSDQYYVNTRSHPKFNSYDDWYVGSDKRYPDELELTPLRMKMWYVTDGNMSKRRENHRPAVRIACTNENDRKGFIISMLEDAGFDATWADETNIYLTVGESEKFYEYIGEPVPGFEYKFPCS